MKRKNFLRVEVFITLFLGVFAVAALSLSVRAPEMPGAAPATLEERGAKIFQRERCFFCHAASNDSAAPPRVTFPLGYLERVAWQWARNGADLTRLNEERSEDWYLAHLINPGAVVAGCSMPFFGQLPEEDIKALVAFLKMAARAAPAASPPTRGAPETMRDIPHTRESYLAGRSLYQTYCSGCHGREGNGTGPIGQLLQPEPRDLSDAAWMRKQSDEYLFRILARGKTETAMPGYAKLLTPRERTLLLFYLKFFADPSARQQMEEGFAP